MPTTPNLQLPELTHGEYNGEVSHNHALQILDLFAQGTVVNHAQASLPGAPAEGDAYIMSGDWGDGGQTDDIAHYYNGTWHFYKPSTAQNAQGWKMYSQVNQNTYFWDGVEWAVYVPVNLPPVIFGQIGLNTGDGSITQAFGAGVAVPLYGFDTADLQQGILATLTPGGNANSATFTVQTAGIYQVSGYITMGDSNVDKSAFAITIVIDGSPANFRAFIDLGNKDIRYGTTSFSVKTPTSLAVGDTVELYAQAVDPSDGSPIAATISYYSNVFGMDIVNTS